MKPYLDAIPWELELKDPTEKYYAHTVQQPRRGKQLKNRMYRYFTNVVTVSKRSHDVI
jgi:hypothetical protein